MAREIVAVLLAVLLPVLSSGCGTGADMSLPDYQENVSELHDGVAWDLTETLEELKELDLADFYDLPHLREVFREAGYIFTAARNGALSLRPPREADAFHAELLGFYAQGAEGMRDRQNALGVFMAVLPMLQDVENLALCGIPDDAGVEEVRAAAAEDVQTMGGYIAELRRMDPPHGLKEYLERLEELFLSIDESAADVDREVTAEDLEPFARFRQWFTVALEQSRALWSEASSFLGDLGSDIDSYLERGRELAERIHEL